MGMLHARPDRLVRLPASVSSKMSAPMTLSLWLNSWHR
jgi:hypothetical protein